MEETTKKRRGRKPMSSSQRSERNKYGFVLKADMRARRKQLEEGQKRYEDFANNCREALENLGIDDVLSLIRDLPAEQREKLKSLI